MFCSDELVFKFLRSVRKVKKKPSVCARFSKIFLGWEVSSWQSFCTWHFKFNHVKNFLLQSMWNCVDLNQCKLFRLFEVLNELLKVVWPWFEFDRKLNNNTKITETNITHESLFLQLWTHQFLLSSLEMLSLHNDLCENVNFLLLHCDLRLFVWFCWLDCRFN